MTRRLRPIAMWTSLVLAPLVAGCNPPPPTNADDVYDYVRNAAVGAEVRRLDTDAQAYVDRIFHACRMWEDRCAPMKKLAELERLWPIDGPDWRDPKAVSDRLRSIETWIEDESDPTDASAKTRAQWYDELLAAIDDVPELPGGTSCKAGDLKVAIAEVLGIERRRELLTRVADGYRRLVTLVAAHASDFDASSTGLTFRAVSTTDQVSAAWNSLHATLTERRDTELHEIEDILANDSRLRDEAIEQKRAIRAGGVQGEADRRRLRELELLVRYYDAKIRNAKQRKTEIEPSAGS